MPGKNAAPTQFSNAARSRPSGVICVWGGGGDPLQSLVKVPAAHFCIAEYWTLVKAALVSGALKTVNASDQIFGMSALVLGVGVGSAGSRSMLTIVWRVMPVGGKAVESES